MNKIINQFQLKVICWIVFLCCTLPVHSQDTTLNRYGLWVIGNLEQLQQTVARDPSKAMTDLKQKIPNIALDLRYTGKNNFMHQQLYPSVSTTWLRRVVADSLLGVQKELNKKGLGLKVFDAYRPYSVTEKMWEPVKDDRYAADPKKGSGHNRGIAVDLTIIDTRTKQELNMGTGFDNFSDTAHHAFLKLPKDILANRLLLKTTMEKHGFKALDTEWWHYYLPAAKDFELLDINFTELERSKL